MRSSKLAWADLARANLLCAELEGANLDGVSLAQACLIGTTYAKVALPIEEVKIPLKIAEMEQVINKSE